MKYDPIDTLEKAAVMVNQTYDLQADFSVTIDGPTALLKLRSPKLLWTIKYAVFLYYFDDDPRHDDDWKETDKAAGIQNITGFNKVFLRLVYQISHDCYDARRERSGRL